MGQKKYKKGYVDASNAYLEFGQKNSAALEEIASEIHSGKLKINDALKELQGNINSLFDYLESKEKSELFNLVKSGEVGDLDEIEADLLVAFISSIATNPNENQKKYLTGLMGELGVKTIAFVSEPDVEIEKIDSTKAKKVMLQTILEYLALQDGDCYDQTESQQIIIDSFCEYLSTKDFEKISAYIDMQVKLIGVEGISCKFESGSNNQAESSKSQFAAEEPNCFDDYHSIGYLNSVSCSDQDETIISGLISLVKHSFKKGETVGYKVLPEGLTGTAKITFIKSCNASDFGKSLNYAEAIDTNIYEVTLQFESKDEVLFDMYHLYKLGCSNTVDSEFESTEDYRKARKAIFDKYIFDIATLPSSVSKDVHSKKIKNAKESYGWMLLLVEAEENILGIIDTTLFGSAKEGFFFTTEGVAYKDLESFAHVIKYEEIDYIEFSKIRKKDSECHLKIHTTDGSSDELSSFSINKTPMKEFLEEMRDYKRKV